ncbi:FAD-binding protein [Streptomyces sp. Ru73]|uniref:FAD-binding oxidoreductase n=1 Tax=Streptomyces sp. Ru73 TaxID=2080748 RepID=UPI000CDE265F|nr:FAD-binding oxidoreductase [Streptomyces sp. Ru73]POX36735.1 FAD-binding protein [Streptomyces sp. Ru73]
MASREMNEAALDGLRAGFAGEVITPGDPAYDAARGVFNAMIDRRPAVIAGCAGVEDVVRAVRFAREQGLEITVRGGGHGVAGKAVNDGGLVVDLRRMNGAVADPGSRTVRVGGGATMADLDRAAAAYGLATTGGRVSTTGVGGYTLGGGSGWLERKYGLTCDNLQEVELVTAAGEVVRADEKEHPELFWALHGGGGNFGVATSFTLRLHELPAFSFALLLWRPEAGPEVMRAYRDFMATAPDEVGGGLLYLTGPDEPFVPDRLTGRLTCACLLTYAGPLAEAREVIAPMLDLKHEGELIADMPYAEFQCLLDDPPGYRNYWSAEYLAELPGPAVDAFCARAGDMVVPSPSQHLLLPQGGAVARGDAGYPVPWRTAPWAVHPLGLWEDPADDERARRWARGLRDDVRPWSTGAVYLNFIGDEGGERVVAGVGADNHERLAAVKAQYDPDQVFRPSHTIRPGRLG